ncbi:Protein-tyrosine phosphatase, partial [Ostertagia ostertagi]
IDGLKQEYSTVSSYRCSDDLYKHDAFLANPDRNRYNDIVCLDATRVVLHHEAPPLTDYIHANWVKFEKHNRAFIMTQAPLANTIGDFWRMVFQENCSSIVNLTQPVEIENLKCVHYWPLKAGSFHTYDKMFVNTKKIDHDDNFLIYTVELLPDGCSNSHIVKLIHMTNWPDKGVPPSGRHVLRLLRKVVVSDDACARSSSCMFQ